MPHAPVNFTAKEIAFLGALIRHKVPFMVVGLSAAALQGAPMVTQDVDLWFRDIEHPGIQKALETVGGIFVPSLGLNPPMFAGKHVEGFDIVLTVHGVKAFDVELHDALDCRLGNVTVKVLPLKRIIASKAALNRAKDRAALPALRSAARAAPQAKPGPRVPGSASSRG